MADAQALRDPLPLRQEHNAPDSTLPAGTGAAVIADRRERRMKKPWIVRKVKATTRMLVLDNLSTMLEAGLSITDAFTILASEMKSKQLREALLSIKYGVEIGKPLSDGFAQYPHIFPALEVATIRVGEASGTLAQVLGRLAEIARRENRLKRKVIGALMYPSVVVFAMIVVGIVMTTYVFPQIISVFVESNIKLPLQIVIIDRLGRIIEAYGLYMLLGIVLAGVGAFYLLKVRRIRKAVDRAILKTPLLGKKILIGATIARLTSNLRTMLISGLPIVEAITIIADTIGNLEYRDTLKAIAHEIETGRSIHDSFSARSQLFPSIVVRMIKVGEDTGKLDDVLNKLAIYYEEKVDDILSNLSTIIEPVLLIVVGVLVGFIAVSIIGPIYEIANNI